MIDPLSLPWGKKAKKVDGPPKPNFLGVRNEAVRDGVGAEHHITIQISGIQGQPNAEFKLAYEPGLQLRHYLQKLKLVHLATQAAMRDVSNPEIPRLRLTYVPNQNSRITMGHPNVSSMMHLQRSRVDAMEVAAKMGSTGRGPPPKVVERKKT
jgi:hypothetical protein